MSDGKRGGKCVLWLHRNPQHYHNLLLDALASLGDFRYVAAFAHPGVINWKDLPLPRVAPTVMLKPLARMEGKLVPPFGRYHADWRKDLAAYPYDMAIVSGYAGRTQRELIRDCRQRGIPVALWSDSNIRSQRGRSLKARVKRSLKRRALAGVIRDVDALLTANSLGVAYWRYYGAPREKIVLSPCYADYAAVEAARSTPRAEVLGRFNLPADARVIVTAARLVPAKGLAYMIRAFRDAGLAGKGWAYLIAGEGPLEAELKTLAGNQLGSAIRFIGFQQPSSLLPLVCHVNLFALPSIYEPHGIVIPEALAGGTPVLASDVVGSAADLVKAGQSGWIFRTGNQASLDKVLTEITADVPRLAAMRASARKAFEDWFARYNPVRVVDALAHRLLIPAEACR